MQRKVQISIVVTHYRTPDLLRACLKSYQDATRGLSVEIIVVDSESDDSVAQMLTRNFPEVLHLRFQENVGYGRLVNAGLERARGGYIFVSNADIEAIDGRVFDRLITFLVSHPRAAIMGPKLVSPGSGRQRSCFTFHTLGSVLARRTWWGRLSWGRIALANFELQGEDLDRPRCADWVQGSAMMIRRSALREIGHLDPRFFMYFEDVDLCRRAWQAGWQVWFNPEVTFKHHYLKSSDSRQGLRDIFTNRLARVHLASYLKYLWKWRHNETESCAVGTGSRQPGTRSRFQVPRVSIVVINFNGWQDTISLLKSLERVTYPNFTVILVDNGSTNSSVTELKRFLDNQGTSNKETELHVEFITLRNNTGFAGGNNAGIKQALARGADYVWLLNNDTEVAPDALERLIEVAAGNSHIGGVAPKIYYHSEPNRIWFAGGHFTWFGGGRHLRFGQVEDSKQPQDSEPQNVNFITGCAMMVKRAVFDRVGLLHEPFFLYYEDTDFCLRAQRKGYKLMYVPRAVIWHKVSRSVNRELTNPAIHYYHMRNALLISQRNAPRWLLPGIYLWSVYKFLKQLPKFIIMPRHAGTACAIMRGILDFYQGKYGKM